MISCNIDLFIAGCRTNCKYCYVDGGPAKPTEIESISYAMKRLEILLPQIEQLGIDVSVTLDNEPTNHRDAIEIYKLTDKHLGKYYFHHASTTGIPLLNHPDKEVLTDTIKELGYGQVGLTLHGSYDSHNKMVCHDEGMTSLIETAKYLYDKDYEVVLSFMLSKVLVEDREKISDILKVIPHHSVYFAVTNGSPVDRLQCYQKQRATLDDVRKLKDYLEEWGFDENKIRTRLEVCHELFYIDELNQLKSWDDIEGSQSNIYLSINSNLDFYYGNTGLEINLIGNLITLTDQEIITAMKKLKANDCNWDTYFKRASLPDLGAFMSRVEKTRTQNYIYPNMDSFLSYWFKRFNYDHY